jgi:hypothetical protein
MKLRFFFVELVAFALFGTLHFASAQAGQSAA